MAHGQQAAPALSLAELMNPEFQAKQAEYENERIAVERGYAYAFSMKFPTVNATIEQARIIAKAYAEDMNKTLAVLERNRVAKA